MKRLGALMVLWLFAVAWLLSGCAGLPVGHRTFLMVGVGVVRIDRADDATGVSTRMVGVQVGCRQVIIGAAGSYCAQLPSTGNVAIIERGRGPDQHLTVQKLPKEGPNDTPIRTARDS